MFLCRFPAPYQVVSYKLKLEELDSSLSASFASKVNADSPVSGPQAFWQMLSGDGDDDEPRRGGGGSGGGKGSAAPMARQASQALPVSSNSMSSRS